MKKLIAAILVVALCSTLVFALCACDGGGSDSSVFVVPEEGWDSETPVTIVFYTTMGKTYTPILEDYIAMFQELYPNITVNYSVPGGYDEVRDQIKTELMEGNEPNVAYCYSDHVADYNLANAVATLDNLIASKCEVVRSDGVTEVLGLTDEQIADFMPGYYAGGKVFGDDLMYTLPFAGKSIELLYYNKTFFEENNIAVPTHWWCDESVCNPATCNCSLEKVMAQIKQADTSNTCIPLGIDSEANCFIELCEQLNSPYTSANGEHFLFDNEVNRNFVKRFNSWYSNKYLTTKQLNGGYTSDLFKEVNLANPHSYMSIGSSAGASKQYPGDEMFEVGVAMIPQQNLNNLKVISQGPDVCIFKKSNPQEVLASWLFVKFLLTSTEFQAEFTNASGYVPTIMSVRNKDLGTWLDDEQTIPDPNSVIANYCYNLEHPDGTSQTGLVNLSIKECLEEGDRGYTFVSPAFVGSSKARDEVGALMQKCIPEANLTDAFLAQAFQEAISECLQAAE